MLLAVAAAGTVDSASSHCRGRNTEGLMEGAKCLTTCVGCRYGGVSFYVSCSFLVCVSHGKLSFRGAQYVIG